MGDAVWFFHHAGTRLGPMTRSDLQESAQRGEIDPDDLVWRPGMAEWEPARNVEGLLPGPLPDADPVVEIQVPVTTEAVPTSTVSMHLRPVEQILGTVHRLLPAERFDRIDNGAEAMGHVAYLLAAVMVTSCLLVHAIRVGPIALIMLAVAVLPTALLLDYSAARFLASLRRRIAACPTKSGSPLFLKGLAAGAFGIGLLSLFLGLSLTLAGAGVAPIVAGMVVSIVLGYAGGALLDPATLNVSIQEEGNAGEECSAALALLAKLLLLRLVPVAFVVGTVVAALAALWILLVSFGGNILPVSAGLWVGGRVLAVALLPMFAWLCFVPVWLVLAIVRNLVRSSDGVPADGSHA